MMTKSLSYLMFNSGDSEDLKGLKYPRILQNRSTNLLLKDYLELCLIAQFMCYDGSAQHRRNSGVILDSSIFN